MTEQKGDAHGMIGKRTNETEKKRVSVTEIEMETAQHTEWENSSFRVTSHIQQNNTWIERKVQATTNCSKKRQKKREREKKRNWICRQWQQHCERNFTCQHLNEKQMIENEWAKQKWAIPCMIKERRLVLLSMMCRLWSSLPNTTLRSYIFLTLLVHMVVIWYAFLWYHFDFFYSMLNFFFSAKSVWIFSPFHLY